MFLVPLPLLIGSLDSWGLEDLREFTKNLLKDCCISCLKFLMQDIMNVLLRFRHSGGFFLLHPKIWWSRKRSSSSSEAE